MDRPPFALRTLLTAAILGGLLVVPLWSSRGFGDDLVQDYVSARAWLRGEDPYQDLQPLRETIGRPQYTMPRVPHNPHPPLGILLAAPVAGFSFETAWRITQAVQALALALAWTWAGARLGQKSWKFAAAGGLLALWGPVWQGIDWGQPVGLLALMAVALMDLARRGVPGLWGALLGFACVLRPFFAPVAVAALGWPRRRIVLAASVAAMAATCLFAALSIWPWEWARRAAMAGYYTVECGSIPGVLGLSGSAGTAFFLGALALLAIVHYRWRNDEAIVDLALLVAMLSYPLAWFQYDVILIPVALHVAVRAAAGNDRVPMLLVFLFVLLRALPNLQPDQKWQLWLQVFGRLLLLAAVVLAFRRPLPSGACS
jgi:hypothetical protein